MSLGPGGPARTIVGQHATVDQYRSVRAQLGLDDPLPVQYWDWLVRVFHGDLGASLFSGEEVTSKLNSRLPVSLSLVVSGTAVSGILGVALGLLSARRGGFLIRAVDLLSLFGLAVPAFWFALVLIAVGAVKLRWFPVTGYVPFADDPVEWGRSLVLPVLSLSLGAAAVIAKQTRDCVLDCFGRDFIRVMQANGFSRRSILYRHVLRNAAVPVATVLGVVLVSLLAAAVFVETVFALPGLGGLTRQATRHPRHPGRRSVHHRPRRARQLAGARGLQPPRPQGACPMKRSTTTRRDRTTAGGKALRRAPLIRRVLRRPAARPPSAGWC